jgi:hypothetical protein
MGCDDVLALVDEALQLSRDRPAMMDICRAYARELRDTLRKRLVGDYGGPGVGGADGDQSDSSSTDIGRLKNPQLTLRLSKRQRRFESRGENVLGRSMANNGVALTQ